MHLSARVEYAAIAAVELARRGVTGGPVGMKVICETHGVPAKFLVHILLDLKRAGIVRSVRGVGGGYLLARPADDITLGAIEAALAGEPESAAPVAAALASSSRVAASLKASWEAAAEARAAALESVTLADLVTRSRGVGEPMYYI